MSNEFFFLVDINLSSIKRSSTPKDNKYINELLEMFGIHRDTHLGYSAEDKTYLMTQAQLAVFTYLRNKCGAQNGYKNLNVRRVSHQGQWRAEDPVDIRSLNSQAVVAPPEKERFGPLAAQIDLLAEEIRRLETGGTSVIGGAQVSRDRLLTALQEEREDALAALYSLVIESQASGEPGDTP